MTCTEKSEKINGAIYFWEIITIPITIVINNFLAELTEYT